MEDTQIQEPIFNDSIELEERLLPTLTMIVYTSILGMFIRLGLSFGFTYEGQIAIPLVYSQLLGCFIIGFITPLKNRIIKIHPSLYTALSSGLCGSITTFSSWNLAIFQEFSSYPQITRTTTPSIQSRIAGGISEILLTLSVSGFAFICGKYLGFQFEQNESSLILKVQNIKIRTPCQNFKSREIVLFIIFGIIPIIVLFLCGYLSNGGRYVISAGFAPLGAYLRYLLSRLNKRAPNFPLGTLTANYLATAILSIPTYFLAFPSNLNENITLVSTSLLMDQTFHGLADGFCGCLSTVSTFIVELASVHGIYFKLRYFFISILISQVILVLFLLIPLLTHSPDKLNYN